MTDVAVAAIRYAPGQTVAPALDAFIARLTAAGVAVHGLRQESRPGHGKDAVDIHTGRRTPLKRPSRHERENRMCSLDIRRLTETTETLRRARTDRADVVIVERFGKAERGGKGLADDLLALMADGIPTLVTVPEEELDAWTRFTGGMGDVVPCDADALWAWWTALKR